MGTRKDTAEYIGQISVCLASLARADGLDTLALMLDMAALEALHELPLANDAERLQCQSKEAQH